ncbi:Cysteine-rich_membrane protein 2 [Hexamita inflata]|uniref:Cysteine-rich membrane protein 2 n=1 Tax=Hexamita inflata TaxID=28002 RepID=A0AA86UZQ9_9EUKA|nr:Cysteine-rich membrane protein 2 [Hexamita inflata]
MIIIISVFAVCANDNECNHGKCDVPNQQCICDQNFDQNTICATCVAGYLLNQDSCILDQCLTNGVNCSQHGICIVQNNIYQCQCNNNFDSTKQCSQCVSGFESYQDQCIEDKCSTGGNKCSSHGSCVVLDNIYQCQCNSNFNQLDKCATCVVGYQIYQDQCIVDQCEVNGVNCSQHGNCVVQNNIYQCQCMDNYDPATKCASCLPGFRLYGTTCILDKCTLPNGSSCNKQGDCKQINFEYVCVCDDHFSDPQTQCTSCLINYRSYIDHCVVDTCMRDSLECSKAGQCGYSQLTNSYLCVCDDLHADSALQCSRCIVGYKSQNSKCYEYSCMDSFGTECYQAGSCQVIENKLQCVCNDENAIASSWCEKCVDGYKIDTKSKVCYENHCIDKNFHECNQSGSCQFQINLQTFMCKCNDVNSLSEKQCTECAPGYRFNDKGICIESRCRFQNISDECFNAGNCIIQGNDAFFTCKCNDSHGISSMFCRECDAGFRFYEGVCYPSTCDVSCNFHGNCLLYKNYTFGCRCYSNYSIESNCKECNTNFDPDQHCLVCKAGHVVSQDKLRCTPQALNPAEISGIVVGVSAVVLMIVGGVYLVFLKKNRFQKVEKEEELNDDEEIYV